MKPEDRLYMVAPFGSRTRGVKFVSSHLLTEPLRLQLSSTEAEERCPTGGGDDDAQSACL